jgi:hypothetical protein
MHFKKTTEICLGAEEEKDERDQGLYDDRTRQVGQEKEKRENMLCLRRKMTTGETKGIDPCFACDCNSDQH